MKVVRILMAALMLAACSSMPVIRPASGPAQEAVCPQVFVSERTRFIHTIESHAAGQLQAVMIGVTLLDPGARSISSAIVSAEGLSLFEASSRKGEIHVSRALPPFDAPDFARNLMDDVKLIFLAPQGSPVLKGVLSDGRPVCRWHREKGGWIDVSRDKQGQSRIERYSENGRLERSVTLAAGRGNTYSAIALQASDLISYALTMTLIESEAVTEDTKN